MTEVEHRKPDPKNSNMSWQYGSEHGTVHFYAESATRIRISFPELPAGKFFNSLRSPTYDVLIRGISNFITQVLLNAGHEPINFRWLLENDKENSYRVLHKQLAFMFRESQRGTENTIERDPLLFASYTAKPVETFTPVRSFLLIPTFQTAIRVHMAYSRTMRILQLRAEWVPAGKLNGQNSSEKPALTGHQIIADEVTWTPPLTADNSELEVPKDDFLLELEEKVRKVQRKVTVLTTHELTLDQQQDVSILLSSCEEITKMLTKVTLFSTESVRKSLLAAVETPLQRIMNKVEQLEVAVAGSLMKDMQRLTEYFTMRDNRLNLE